jgi:oxygen-independent coproporphyrinogen III oxidase
LSFGIYISVPFCRTKCSFCNFASNVFSATVFDKYVAQACSDVESAPNDARQLGGVFEPMVDSIYLGGGTPSVLIPEQLDRIFTAVRQNFEVIPGAEITVECAPGTIGSEILDTLVASGVNRVSLGVQSFVDKESSSVGRLHTRAVTLDDIARLRAAGIGNIGIDLIAGLPHQTDESWNFSVSETLATGVPHVSVYMLEVDEDSRLGSELLAGGSRYHAHFVPDEDLTADLYLAACERLERGDVRQYEISNFARPVTHGIGLRDSRHNLKYWTRQPYLGFGVDAHSMLTVSADLNTGGAEAVRFATPDSLETYSLAGSQAELRVKRLRSSLTLVDRRAAIEESFFLGLRMNRGVPLEELKLQFGDAPINAYHSTIDELKEAGLLEESANRLCLTPRGRLLSNEVFGRFLSDDATGANEVHTNNAT